MGCVQPELLGKSQKYINGYHFGQQEALREIQNDALTIYTAGLSPSLIGDVQPGVDEETGLPERMVGACIVFDYQDGRMEGHNQLVREFVLSITDSEDWLVQQNPEFAFLLNQSQQTEFQIPEFYRDSRILEGAIAPLPNATENAKDILILWRGAKYLLNQGHLEVVHMAYKDDGPYFPYRVVGREFTIHFYEYELRRWISEDPYRETVIAFSESRTKVR